MRRGLSTLTPLKTYPTPSTNPPMTYPAPPPRESALAEDDWERAYALACREEGVQYLAAPQPQRSKNSKKS